MIKPLSLSLLLSLYSSSAFSWGSIGHQIVGEIAERNLTPSAISAITDIIGPEKIALAAVWADNVRDDSSFDPFKSYHFISLGDAPYESIPDHEHDSKDSMTILKKVPELLIDPKVSRSVKLVALKYLIHIVGDVHQPLHVGKKSDSGGNACKVLWNQENVSLHQVWDTKLVEFDMSQLRVHNFIAYADILIKNLPNPKTFSLDFNEWIRESQTLRTSAYPTYAPQNFCLKEATEFPLLDENYKKNGVLITRERLLAGGLRLALLLNDVFKEGSNPGTNISLSKKQILDQLNLTNY
jgi:hypothetical protein